jgi:hypothetical protein
MLKTFIKISFENENIFKIRQKCRAIYMKKKYLYIVGSNICSSTIQTELTVALPLQHSVLYAVDSEMWVSSIQNMCCVSMTVMVM